MKELEALATRARNERISQELRQTDLAEKAAVALNAIRHLETARPIRTDTLARILIALGQEGALSDLLPEPVASPLDFKKLQGNDRKRVR